MLRLVPLGEHRLQLLEAPADDEDEAQRLVRRAAALEPRRVLIDLDPEEFAALQDPRGRLPAFAALQQEALGTDPFILYRHVVAWATRQGVLVELLLGTSGPPAKRDLKAARRLLRGASPPMDHRATWFARHLVPRVPGITAWLRSREEEAAASLVRLARGPPAVVVAASPSGERIAAAAQHLARPDRS